MGRFTECLTYVVVKFWFSFRMNIKCYRLYGSVYNSKNSQMMSPTMRSASSDFPTNSQCTYNLPVRSLCLFGVLSLLCQTRNNNTIADQKCILHVRVGDVNCIDWKCNPQNVEENKVDISASEQVSNQTKVVSSQVRVNACITTHKNMKLLVSKFWLPVNHSGANVIKPPYNSPIAKTTIQKPTMGFLLEMR